MKIDWTSLPETEGMRRGATRKAVSADKLSAVLVETSSDADFDGKLHWHENEQILVMLKGEATLKVDNEVIYAEKGDMVFFPSGSKHGLIGCGSEGCTYYEIFSPPRVDYLPGWIGKTQLRFD